jgi:hypothetical protein
VRAPVLLLAALIVLTGCGGSTTPTVRETEPPGPAVLSAGTNELALQPGKYLSPDGFVPALALTVPAGWTSSHRGDDAFDLRRALVTVALVTPNDDNAARALTRLRKAARGAVTNTSGTLVGRPATGFDAVGGSGRLITSPSRTVVLDASPRGHLRVLGTDVDGVPLLAIVVIPDASRWPELSASAQQLLEGVTAA